MDNTNQNPKQALAEKIKDCKNILVTVSANPSVDQLSALLGLTIWLNKINKHATAVFSGEVPSTLEFLQPAETLEKNTDSLRDFIISLDKSKADKLRYKVEDSVVKVFVTPYRTSLTADDLEFSQGDFNVDLVIALGVHKQDELDGAITAHGRILHDATVATVTIGDTASELGSISWHDQQASSLSELVVELANDVDQEQIDGQIATALLTGVVAETERFSNSKTTPQTMSVSAQLMSAGANQQLVATKLEESNNTPAAEPPDNNPETPENVDTPPAEEASHDGALSIEHQDAPEEPAPEPVVEPEAPAPEPEPPVEAPAAPEEEPAVSDVKETAPEEQPAGPELTHFADPTPPLSGILTANAEAEDVTAEPTADPLSQLVPEDATPLMDHNEPGVNTEPATADPMQPAPPDWMPAQPWMTPAPAPEAPAPEQSAAPAPPPDLNVARDEVLKAIESVPASNPEPIQALNAQPIDLNPPTAGEPAAPTVPESAPGATTAFNPAAFNVPVDPNAPVDPDLLGPVDQTATLPLPGTPLPGSPLTPPPADPTPPTSVEFDPTAPPPVPPPMPFKQQ